MVDRIEKLNPDPYRIQESKDATDDNSGNKQDAESDNDADNFDKLNNKTDWQILFDKTDLWKQNTQVKLEDIDKIKLLGVNFKTNPALLNVRVFLFDGNVISSAYLSVPRELALKIKNMPKLSHLDVNMLTRESSLWLTTPKEGIVVDDEITKISHEQHEKTFSQTFKRLISRKNLVQRLGMQDPVSKRVNNEIIWIYLTALVVISAILFGVGYLLI